MPNCCLCGLDENIIPMCQSCFDQKIVKLQAKIKELEESHCKDYDRMVALLDEDRLKDIFFAMNDGSQGCKRSTSTEIIKAIKGE